MRQAANRNLGGSGTNVDINVFKMQLPGKSTTHEFTKLGWDLEIPASDANNKYEFDLSCTSD